ncbi:MAG: putative flippase GtrA [Candidatus Azotimanducaceae bacterium]|jgi:putative flippase GtrA
MQLFRFAIVGALVALVYVLAYVALLTLGMNQPLANAVAFLAAIALQYVGQASFTFGKRINDRTQMVRFFCMTGLGFLTAALVTGIIGPMLEAPNWASAIAVTIILPVQNYIIMTVWVFAQTTKSNEVAL